MRNIYPNFHVNKLHSYKKVQCHTQLTYTIFVFCCVNENVTKEISVVVCQDDGNQSTSRTSYTNIDHKGQLIPPQRHLFNCVHCFSTHNS